MMHNERRRQAMKNRKPYEKPAVVLERELEALAADCGTGVPNIYLGDVNCKAAGACTITFS
jgi:hypothetical protein